jgi:YgiT-type zinc finger domain-containing protein
MTTKTNNRLCAVCGDELKATTITHEVKRGGDIYLFQHVPAKVCTARGEMWIDEEVLQVIDRLIESGVPARKVETPVYDYCSVTA